jgi:hypothetical protein
MKRIVEPEMLDELPPDDPRAIRSRRDLRRVNAWMRNHAIMAGTLIGHCPGTPARITELGAGDGHFLLRVAQNLAARWPDMSATLLDRQDIVSPETLAAFAALGWRAEAAVADVFDRPEGPGGIVVANLFLHHFEDGRLAELLRAVAQRAKLFIAIEPHRFALPLLCGQLLWLIGCNAVTRHDAVVSIRAGFLDGELSALWPDRQNWRLTERRAGRFSHLFIAHRIS